MLLMVLKASGCANEVGVGGAWGCPDASVWSYMLLGPPPGDGSQKSLPEGGGGPKA